MVVPSLRRCRIASRRQFARPAVEESFLDHLIWMPPVDEDSWATWPFVRAWSTSARKERARSCFLSLKALRWAMAVLSFLAGLLDGLLRGETIGEISSSLSSGSTWRCRRIDFGVFRGEYWSFQSLMTSWLQNASMLGLCGVGGIGAFFDGDCKRGLIGLEGGVSGPCFSLILWGDLDSGGELLRLVTARARIPWVLQSKKSKGFVQIRSCR